MEPLWAFLHAHLDKIPFVVAATNNHMRVRVSGQRILEAVIIGAVLAGVGYVMVIPSITRDLAYITTELYGIRLAVKEVNSVNTETLKKDAQQDARIGELERRLNTKEARGR